MSCRDRGAGTATRTGHIVKHYWPYWNKWVDFSPVSLLSDNHLIVQILINTAPTFFILCKSDCFISISTSAKHLTQSNYIFALDGNVLVVLISIKTYSIYFNYPDCENSWYQSIYLASNIAFKKMCFSRIYFRSPAHIICNFKYIFPKQSV